MSTDSKNDSGNGGTAGGAAAVDVDDSAGKDRSGAAGGDDERDSRDQIERTGEPKRDALGNGDGAS